MRCLQDSLFLSRVVVVVVMVCVCVCVGGGVGVGAAVLRIPMCSRSVRCLPDSPFLSRRVRQTKELQCRRATRTVLCGGGRTMGTAKI